MAAAAVGQLSYAAAIAHKDNVWKVVARARLETPKLPPSLGIAYDQVCRSALCFIWLEACCAHCVRRRLWAERSVCGDLEFKIEDSARVLDEVCLTEARAQVLAQSKVPKGSSKGTATLTCTKCGRNGHTAEYCRGDFVVKCWMQVVCCVLLLYSLAVLLCLCSCDKPGHTAVNCPLKKANGQSNDSSWGGKEKGKGKKRKY